MGVDIKDGTFMRFQEMKQNYTLCNQDHFKYLQLRDFYEREVKPNVNLDKNGIIRRGNTTLYVKQKWEKDLGVNISEDEWLHIWITQQSTASSSTWREYCWKNLIRFFVTPQIRSKFLSVTQPCWTFSIYK